MLYVNWLSFNYRDKKKSVCLQEHRHLVSLRSDLARLECRLEKDLCVGHSREALQTGMTVRELWRGDTCQRLVVRLEVCVHCWWERCTEAFFLQLSTRVFPCETYFESSQLSFEVISVPCYTITQIVLCMSRGTVISVWTGAIESCGSAGYAWIMFSFLTELPVSSIKSKDFLPSSYKS